MKASVTVDVLRVHICSQLDQCLHILDVHRDSGEVESCSIFTVRLGHPDIVTAGEEEYREDTFVPLCGAMHDGLITQGFLVRIALEVNHQHLDHVSVARGCCQMDGLRPHV